MTIARNLSFLAEGVSSTGVLGATYGGTGQSSITTGDLLYGSASNTISKLAIGSTGTILRVVAGVPSWGTDYTGTVTSVAALTLGTTGTDLSSTVANETTTPVITLNVPTASATNRGVLSSTDWTTFNNKGSGSVTSVAASVPSFLSISGSPITTSGTLAITYSGTALPVANGGSGLTSLTANYIPYGNGTSAFNSSANFQYTGSNLLVNTSTTYSPYAKAHFYNGIAVAIDSSNGGFYLGCTTSGSELAYLSLGGNYNLGSTGQIALATDTAKEILFGIANVEAMRITTSRTLQTQTSISVGGATPTTSGAGITFPATQSASTDANTLDDYEEGTWTVTLVPSTSGTITINGSYNTGTYTKIGNQVTVSGLLFISSVSSPVGTAQIQGLPFTIRNNNNAYGACPLYVEGILGATTAWQGKLNKGVSYIELYVTALNNPTASAGVIQANTIIAFTATYFV